MIKILFIDDDRRSADHISAILNEEGYEVIFVSSPMEAIKAVEKYGSDIALIVLDLMMNPAELPDEFDTDGGIKTGLVLYQKNLKKLIPNTPVIVMTAIGSITILKETKKEEMVFEILHKPVNIFELERCIDKAINKH